MVLPNTYELFGRIRPMPACVWIVNTWMHITTEPFFWQELAN